ncbi:MAG: FecR family protein [Candidatus Cyclobacteriaceae bacterium M3_2C_046]
MQEKELKILFKKYLNNQVSETELEKIRDLLQDQFQNEMLLKVIREEAPLDFISYTSYDPQVYQRIGSRLRSEINSRSSISRSLVASLAAGLLLMIVAGLALWFHLQPYDMKYVGSGYGQTRDLVLPDSSKVLLNANSNLFFPDQWSESSQREVYLQGEAFFQVRKDLVNYRKFIVRTDNISIEVLGTEFNVYERNGKSKVILNSGQIRLNLSPEWQVTEIDMKPGEMVELDFAKHQLIKRKTDAKEYMAWTNNQLIFDYMPLTEVASVLEELHGVKICLAPLISGKQFSGTFPLDDLMIVLKAISQTYNQPLILKEELITIGKPDKRD